jgi:hypothetical protein
MDIEDDCLENELIREIIQYLPKATFHVNKIGDIKLYLANNRSIVISSTSSWPPIKTLIDALLIPSNGLCSICTVNTKQIRLVVCELCCCRWCDLCRMRIFYKNKGISKCPECDVQSGSLQNHYPFWIEDSLRIFLREYSYKTRKEMAMLLMDEWLEEDGNGKKSKKNSKKINKR